MDRIERHETGRGAQSERGPEVKTTSNASGHPGSLSALELKSAGTEAFERRDFKEALRLWGAASDVASKTGDDELWKAARANYVLAEMKRERWEEAECAATEILAWTRATRRCSSGVASHASVR